MKTLPRFLVSNLLHLARWCLLVAPMAAVVGTASAGFLWLLDQVTKLRLAHGWLAFLLPAGGLVMAWVYARFGKSAEAGSNLILEQIHEAGGGVPKRMAPLILFTTLGTHLFGGSAGREGTAIQIGGSIASGFAGGYRRWLRMPDAQTRLVLMAGVSAGFSSMFGTPLAGAVFAMEVLTIGRLEYEAFLPILIAALVGDATCLAWGAHHAVYLIAPESGTGGAFFANPLLLAKVCVAGVLFGLAAWLFSEFSHAASAFWKRTIANPLFRPVAGGVVVIALTYLVGTRDYLGIGTFGEPGAVTIGSAFHPGGATDWSWLLKVVFTVATLSCGFKGGEVTPLFFIGATLGNTLAGWLGAPVDLFAGLGLIAVFAAAANTPLACVLLGVELFGAEHAVYYVVACTLAYYFSGHSGIYLSQKVGLGKRLALLEKKQRYPEGISLREMRQLK